ncbi:MAG: magnesium transporter [Alphaproteobacteria bacterium]|nr:MAG: magnesium transporter [Alphaproteobacteria bacterium]
MVKKTDIDEKLNDDGEIIGAVPDQFTDDDIQDITDALHEGDDTQVHDLIDDLTSAESAELLEKIVSDDRNELVEKYLSDFDPETFVDLDDDLRKDILEKMDAMTVAKIVSDLDSDDAVEMLYNLDPVFQKDIIKKLSAKNRATVEEGLTFEEDSAGRLMQREFVAVPLFWSVGKTIDYLRAAADTLPNDFFDLFIIDPSYHVIGMIPLNQIIRSERSEKIENLLLYKDIHVIPADMDQEDVARIFKREDLVSTPVVDSTNRLIGVITVDDIVDVIEEEAEEDILRLAGVSASGTDMYRDVMDTAKSRFSWLAVNLVTAILASVVIGLFDATIQQIVALAVLMPIVASMGGNAGTQTLTIAVRALATRDLSRTNMMRMIGKETLVGFLNGFAFAVISALVTYAWFNDPILAGIIGLAMIINLIVAGLFGIGIPITLDRFGIDPALASSVFLTTVTDIVGFFAFLGLAALFLI